MRLAACLLGAQRERERKHVPGSKAVYWWCYMHAECPLPAAEILRVMPTDDDIAREMRAIGYEDRAKAGPRKWGDGLVWEELHRSVPWRREWD